MQHFKLNTCVVLRLDYKGIYLKFRGRLNITVRKIDKLLLVYAQKCVCSTKKVALQSIRLYINVIGQRKGLYVETTCENKPSL